MSVVDTTDLMVRDAVRQFIDKEIRPQDALEAVNCRRIRSRAAVQPVRSGRAACRVGQPKCWMGSGLSGKRSSWQFRALADQASMVAVLVSELAGVSLGLLSTVAVASGCGDDRGRSTYLTGALDCPRWWRWKRSRLSHYRARLRLRMRSAA